MANWGLRAASDSLLKQHPRGAFVSGSSRTAGNRRRTRREREDQDGRRLSGGSRNESRRDSVEASARRSSPSGSGGRFGFRGGGGPRGGRGAGTSSSGARTTIKSSRWIIPFLVCVLVAAVFAVKLVWLQVIMADEYSSMASETRSVDIEASPRRGTIYDRNGTVLAISVECVTVYANPAEVEDIDEAAALLADYLDGDAETYKESLSQDTTFVYIERKIDTAVAEALEEGLIGDTSTTDDDISGIYFLDDMRREYPCGSIGAQIIGLTDDDGDGISGLELYYDEILSGTPGRLTYETGMYGIPIPGGVVEDTPAVDGQDIVISIDIQLQDYLEQRLEQAAEECMTDSTTAIVMDAETGEIYAAASLPLLDPNDRTTIAEGATTIRSITGAIEPGSIFKTVSTLAILEEGAMTPDDTLFCPAYLEADGYWISDAHERSDETMSLREILDNSSNVGISLAVEGSIGFETLYDYILAYGFTELTGIDYPGEALGYLSDQDTWSLVQSYNVTFGQGVSVTPLQMLRFYGAIANDGVATTPHFLISLPQSGETPSYETEQIIENSEVLDTMTSMLQSVVSEGTGTAAAIDGFNVAGKTSTAEVYDEENGGYKSGIYNIAFTGFVPDASSSLVCYVGAYEVPYQATVTSAFKDIMSYAIDRFSVNPE